MWSKNAAAQEIKKLIPLAASLGQMILIENVWNQMFYNHGAPPEQTADAVREVHRQLQQSLGRHVLRHRQPLEVRPAGRVDSRIRTAVRQARRQRFQSRRPGNDWTEITEGDLPWDQVRKALDEIGFAGWATAEVGGGDVKRLTTVREQMQKAFGV